MSDSDDEGQMDEAPEERRPPLRFRKKVQKVNDSYYLKTDFSRPWPAKEDVVVYKKKNGMGLGQIHKIKKGGMKHSPLFPADVFSGQVANVESTLTSKCFVKSVEEVLVVDRPFAAGETVVTFKNKYPLGHPQERELWNRDDVTLGVVIKAKSYCDVLTVPDRRFVLRDVFIDKEPEYAEMIGFNLAHNYVMYNHWIGDAKDTVNDLTCIYRNNKLTARVVIREAGDRSRGVILSRNPQEENKSIVPQEIVLLSANDLHSPFVRWQGPCPSFLKRKIKKKKGRIFNEWIRLVVEKVEPYELEVDWLTSPSDPIEIPPKRLPREELHKVQRLDIVPDPRVSPMDRILVRPKETDVMVTKTEYFKDLAQKYANSFRSWKSPLAEKEGSSSSSSDEEATEKSSEPSPKMPKIDEEAEDEMMEEENTEDHDGEEAEEGAEEMEDGEDEGNEEGSEENMAEENEGPVGIRRRVKGRRHRAVRVPFPTARGAKELYGDSFYGEILMTKTLITVKWMDGTIQEDIPGCQLMPIDADLDQQDHIPGVLVSKKGEPPSELKFGLILSTDTTDRSCMVRWFRRADVNSPLQMDEEDEEITLFNIMPNPDYTRLFLGYYGVNLNKSDSQLKNIAYQVIADLENGKQLVRYFDGKTEELWPDEITPLNFEEDGEPEEEEATTDEEMDQVDHTQFEDYGQNIPPGVTVQSVQLKTLDTPQDVCERMYELLKSATVDSLFEALGLCAAAIPAHGEIASQRSENDGLLPDRSGRYLEVYDKVLWDINHENVIEAADYFKAKHIFGLTMGDPRKTINLDDRVKFPDALDKMIAVVNKNRHERLSSPYSEREIVHTLTRMAKIAAFALKHTMDPNNNDGVVIVTGFESAKAVKDRVISLFREAGYFIGESFCLRDDRFILLQVDPQDEILLCDRFHTKIAHESKKMMVMTLQEAIYFFVLDEFLKTKVVDRLGIRNDGSVWKDEEVEQTAVAVVIEKEEVKPNCAPSNVRVTEKIPVIQVIGDFAEEDDTVDLFWILSQAVRSSTYPHITISAKTKKLGYDECVECFLDDFMKLSRVGIISGPYFNYQEVFDKFIELVVRKVPYPVQEAGIVDQYRDQLTSLRNLLHGQHFEHWKRMNHILASGFLPEYFHESFIDKSREGARKIPISKLIRVKNEAKNAELKNELDLWCRILKLEKEETKKKEEIPRFEMLSDHPASHTFASRAISANRKFFQAVLKEHKFLRQHLPEGIYVRAYSDRMDLMNAVIVGPAGTPFEGVPFIFDICIPERYPKSPPEVHYIAFSQEQLNPNLYQAGKVCTSLLGTWSGEGSENWSSSSNIQQVLISIQSLILVSEPYFNEAGYEARRARPDAKYHSERYNETVTVNALDYLYNVFVKPPKYLEDIVQTEVLKSWPIVKGLCASWSEDGLPQFPICASKGFRMAVKNAAEKMDVVVEKFKNEGGVKLKKGGDNPDRATDTVSQHDESYLLISKDVDLDA